MREQQNGRRSVPVMAWLFTASLALLPQLSLAGPMDLGGHFAVSDSGAATYSIPLQVPPGTAGIEPKLALTYNSQSGNGLLGVGWSLSGLSAITRCPRTMAQDGYRGSVNFDANDRYCLDGQRLMVISGTDGGDGAEYRTERESFSKIVSYGTAGNGPAWFKVWTKGGQIIEYGNTGDSRIEAQYKASVRVWAQNKLSDTKGNYYTVTYTEDNANGDYYPARIDYTGNSITGLAPFASVQFTNAARTDIETGYEAGSVIKQTKRMVNVKTFNGTGLAKDYRLVYEQSTAIQRSRLINLTECDEAGGGLQAIALSWKDAIQGYSYQGNWIAAFAGPDTNNSRRLADVNGDGRADIVAFGTDGVYVALSTGAGFAYQGRWIAAFAGPDTNNSRRLADVNGDGRTDIIEFGTDGVYVALSTGAGFAYQGRWIAAFAGPDVNDYYHLVDVNGDGKADIVGFGTDGVYVALSTGTGFAYQGRWLAAFANVGNRTSQYRRLADVNGDGQMDLVSFDVGGVYVALSTGTGFNYQGNWIAAFAGPDTNNSRRLADVNGDGKDDIIEFGTDGVYVAHSTGTGFAYQDRWIAAFAGPVTNNYNHLVDVNGDGKADIVGFGADGVYVALSTGAGFAYQGQWLAAFANVGSRTSQYRRLADVNGDGQVDLVSFGADGVSVGTSNGRSNLLATLTTGLGTTIAYKPTTDPAVYTKGTNSTYPLQDVQAPFYVVSSVSTSNGIGGKLTTNYKYGGLKAELGTGRGLLGFNWIESTQVETGLVTRTTNRQDWPYVGLPSEVKKTQSSASGPNKQISLMTATYGCHNPQDGSACTIAAGKRYLPYASQSIESNWDLNGATLPVITRTQTVDLYGNPTVSTISTNDGYSTSTTNTYQNDTTNWYLGRLLRTQVQSTTP